MKKCYKCLDRYGLTGKLWSYQNLALPEQFRLEYMEGAWTWPKVAGTRVYVFEDLFHAETFYNYGLHIEIWEGEYIGDIVPFRTAELWALYDVCTLDDWESVVKSTNRIKEFFTVKAFKPLRMVT